MPVGTYPNLEIGSDCAEVILSDIDVEGFSYFSFKGYVNTIRIKQPNIIYTGGNEDSITHYKKGFKLFAVLK